jgi:hypothetical protein
MARSNSADFGRILDGLVQPDHAPGAAARRRSRGFVQHLAEAGAPSPKEQVAAPSDRLSRAYTDDTGIELPNLPEWERLDVAAELGLTPDLSTADLHRIRRAFALSNHPDRVVPEHRELATRRMTVANALIDQALRTRAAAAKG